MTNFEIPIYGDLSFNLIPFRIKYAGEKPGKNIKNWKLVVLC